jgi:hypothetical protein
MCNIQRLSAANADMPGIVVHESKELDILMLDA